MFTRASFFVFAVSSVALVAAAACSSTDTPRPNKCDVEVACYQIESDGFCGAELSSQPCEACPVGYTTQCKQRPQPDSGTTDAATTDAATIDAAVADGASDASDAAPE